jgi:TolB-like protein
MIRRLLFIVLVAPLVAHGHLDGGSRPVVAVLYFDVDERLGELTVFRKGLAQMLITDLVASDRLTVVERERLEEVTRELDLRGSRYFKNGQLIDVGAFLQASWKVTGTILPMKDGLLIDARVISVRTASVVKTARVVMKADDVLEGEQQLAQKLTSAIVEAERLGKWEPPAKPSSKLKLKLKTAVRYSEALSAKDLKDSDKARQMLEAVVKDQPDFILARMDLAALAK